MSSIQFYQAMLPLLKATIVEGTRSAPKKYAADVFIGTATIFRDKVCTCKHVLDKIDFSKSFVVSQWSLMGDWVIFDEPQYHPKFDFAVLRSTVPPFAQLPIYADLPFAGTSVFAGGFDFDETSRNPDGSLHIDVAPRIFGGNVVRVHERQSNKARTLSELSFPTLSGLSGGPVFSQDFSSILGMVYGNIEQTIQVHSVSEVSGDGSTTFKETINRIVEYGLFHTSKDILSYLDDMR
jgi:hypothetical protein